MTGLPLIDQIALLLERTYDFSSGVPPMGRFVVGDTGHALLRERGEAREAIAHSGEGARLLLRQPSSDADWSAALYLPNAMIQHLERHDPRRELGEHNVDAFATLVEEVDHLLTFADQACRGAREISLLELEWHAGVSKYLVLTHFVSRLSGGGRLSPRARSFVDHHVFHKGEFVGPDPHVRGRYRDANRFALRTVRVLRRRTPHERLRALRRFHRASHHEKLRRYAS